MREKKTAKPLGKTPRRPPEPSNNTAAAPKNLAQANVDFTAEGSPPPGLVAAGKPPKESGKLPPFPDGGKKGAS